MLTHKVTNTHTQMRAHTHTHIDAGQLPPAPPAPTTSPTRAVAGLGDSTHLQFSRSQAATALPQYDQSLPPSTPHNHTAAGTAPSSGDPQQAQQDPQHAQHVQHGHDSCQGAAGGVWMYDSSKATAGGRPHRANHALFT